MIQIKHIKKVTSLFLILVAALLLVACTNKAKVPYGDLGDTAYLTIGKGNEKTTISERDLYDSLRKQGASVLTSMINEKLLEGYLTNAKSLLKNTDDTNTEAVWAQELFDELVNQAIFSSNDVETIKKIKDVQKELTIAKYVDTLYASDNSVDREKVSVIVSEVVNNPDSEDFATGYAAKSVEKNYEYLINKFALDVAKRIYAKGILEDEVKDEDNDNYIKDTSVISYYKNNIKGRHDVEVFYFYFLSLNEANSALRLLNLKADSRGNWYEIPDIRVWDWENEYPEQKSHIESVLQKLGLLTQAQTQDAGDNSKTMIKGDDYKKYYDAYSPSSSRETKLDEFQVLKNFVLLHNLVNDKKLEELDEENLPVGVDKDDVSTYVKALVYKSGTNEEDRFIETYNDLNTLNSSFRSYIYDTLNTNVDKGRPYSTLRSVSNYRYLAFKFDDINPSIDLVSEEKDDDNNEKWATIDELKATYEENLDAVIAAYPEADNGDGTVNWTKVEELITAQKLEWYNEVKDTKLTSSYASTKVSELLEDNLKVEIYDNVLRTYYNQSATITAKGKNLSGNVVAKVTATIDDTKVEFEITVNDLYKSLEEKHGVTVALDLAVNEVLLSQENARAKADKLITSDMKKEFETELKTLLTNFSNDQFASAGYPASMGREAFLLLIFGTTNNKEALELGYMLPKLRELFLADYENQLDVDVYEQLEKYAALQYEKAKGVTVSHLLVYFDTDGDGSPEDPKEYLEGLDPLQVEEVEKAIIKLYKDVISLELGNSSGIASGLTKIAEEFQNAIRLEKDQVITELQTQWNEFRRLGINLKFESISSTITNTSNFITNSSTLDTVFYDRAIYLLDFIEGVRNDENEDGDLVDGGLPFLDFDSNSLNVIPGADILDRDGLSLVKSDFGFHFILVTGISEKTSAVSKFPTNWATNQDDDDYTFKDEDGTYLSAYNDDSETITVDQIKYYVRGNKLEEGILLPSSVQTAFTNYFSPVFTLYTGSNMQSAILFKLLEDNDLKLEGNASRFEAIKEINRSQFFGYLIKPDNTSLDSNYSDLYSDWFIDFGLEA